MDQEELKRLAAEAALEHLPEQGVVGLGTGSTVRYFIEALARLIAGGRKLSGVPTSEQSRKLAESLGIPLLDDEGPWAIDLCVDGADEVSEDLHLIKGGGGAHTREKLVNSASRMNLIVVDDSKMSRRLGEDRALPIEVLRFAHRTTASALGHIGEVYLRRIEDRPFLTDSGNYIYDMKTGPIANPAALDQRLHALPGVVETGLFCARADVVIVAGSEGIQILRRR